MNEILKVEHVSKKIGKTSILTDISFEIKEGEIVALVGPNGVGKTTLLRILCNLVFPTSGKIEIGGADIIKEREKALSNLSCLIENPGLFEDLSGRENLEIIRILHRKSKAQKKEIEAFTGLDKNLNQKSGNYSLGMKQRLMLGMCLLSEPKLLILDEPTNGLDPNGVLQFISMIQSLAKERKTAVLISSHLLSDLEKICDRALFIKDGVLISAKGNEMNAMYARLYL